MLTLFVYMLTVVSMECNYTRSATDICSFSCARNLDYQGVSFFGIKLPGTSQFPLVLPSPLPNSFLQRPTPREKVKPMYTSGIILVTGAIGDVSKRVVNLLQRKGLRVRALVRNEEKARRLLGPDVNLITGDVTKASGLITEHFKRVRAVINTVSFIVGPKEGDTPDRTKYTQFWFHVLLSMLVFDDMLMCFHRESSSLSQRLVIKGDSPEMVEFIGMKNLSNVVKGTVGLRHGKVVFGFEDNSSSRDVTWSALDDVVMGGVSESSFQIDPNGGESGGPTGTVICHIHWLAFSFHLDLRLRSNF